MPYEEIEEQEVDSFVNWLNKNKKKFTRSNF